MRSARRAANPERERGGDEGAEEDGEESEGMSCAICESPTRKLWVPTPQQPKFERISPVRHGLYLGRCPSCRAFWVIDECEPYASFPYAVPWPMTIVAWESKKAEFGPTTFDNWHRNQIAEGARFLSDEEREAWKRHVARAGPSHAPALPGTMGMGFASG